MGYEYDDPIISNVRKGTQDSPYKEFNETLIIDNSGKAQLTEYPNTYSRVIVTGDNKDWFETNEDIPDVNSFKVDYIHKIVTFNLENIGKQLNFNYKGMGNSAIPVSSVYVERDGMKITDTLKTLSDSMLEARNIARQTNTDIQKAEDTRVQNESTRESQHNTRMQEVDDAITTTLMNYLEQVPLYADILTTYPNPSIGDTVELTDPTVLGQQWRWNGTNWIHIATKDVSHLDSLRIVKSDIAPTDTMFWLDTTVE